jgi:hypothetical protein
VVADIVSEGKIVYMKKVLGSILIVLSIATWFGCKKDQGKPSNELEGYWELTQSTSRMPTVNHPPGNGNLLVIKDNKYAWYANGQTVKSGTFTTMEDTTAQENVCLIIPKDQFTRRIVYDTSYSKPKTFYDIRDGKLSFVSGCFAYDAGHKEVYRRVEPNDKFPLE